MGSLPFNAIRMSLSLLMFAIALWLMMGVPYPRYADGATWGWLLLSGLVGCVIGDYCLMQGYIIIGSRFGQLFMTLSAPSAAIAGRLFLGEAMRPMAIVGMVVTLIGIAMSVFAKNEGENLQQGQRLKLNLPLRGTAYACAAGICQGIGLVLSKKGLLHYDASISAAQMAGIVQPGLIEVPLDISTAFASTMIRGIMGLVGFLLMMVLLKGASL